MKVSKLLAGVFTFAVTALVWPVAQAANDVIITPLGSQEGEFCRADRALLFEDPTGVRILTAPGRTVNGSEDPRLPTPEGSSGGVHVLLIDHAHSDHWGDAPQNCSGQVIGAFAFPSEGNTPEIAAVHNSAVLVGGELPDFATQKIANVAAALGTPAPVGCPAADLLNNNFTVPRTSPCVGVIRGGTRTAIFQGQSKGVKITTIPAFHAAGAPKVFIDPPNVPDGLTGYAGHETGYIIRFTNGLTVLWTGDSGLIGDWETQSQFYKVNLAILHIGDLFTMGPDEAAFAVNTLIQPKTAIAEHANEPATTGGEVNAATRTERFIQRVNGNIRVLVPLSGVKIRCNGGGRCRQDKSPSEL